MRIRGSIVPMKFFWSFVELSQVVSAIIPPTKFTSVHNHMHAVVPLLLRSSSSTSANKKTNETTDEMPTALRQSLRWLRFQEDSIVDSVYLSCKFYRLQ